MLSDDDLDHLATLADPEVDRLVAEVAGPGSGRSIEDEMLRMVRLGRVEGAPVADYFDQRIPLPAWADPEKLPVARDFYANWGLQLSMGLYFACLPRSYTAATGARALTVTATMTSNLERRIAETGKFLIDVMAMDDPAPPLGPDSSGQRAARGVRLFHGVVRRWLVQDSQDWDIEEHGVPINQEDMLATMLLFSVAALDALDRMGVPYSVRQAEAYVHAWCVAGDLMGVGRIPGDETAGSILPLGYAEARELGLRIEARHRGSTEHGRQLADALIAHAVELTPFGMGWLPRTMLIEISSQEVADLLGVKRGPWPAHALFSVLRHTNRVSFALFRTTPFAAVGALVGRIIIRAYIRNGRGHRPPWAFDEALGRWRTRRRQLLLRRRKPMTAPDSEVPTSTPSGREDPGRRRPDRPRR